MEIALRVVDAWIAYHAKCYICVTPVHSVMDCQRDPDLLRIFNASGFTTHDGTPLVWLCRLKGFHHVDRVYGPDMMLTLCEDGVRKGYRHCFYGGAEGIPEQLAAVLEERFPGVQVAGTCSPPFRLLTPEEDQQTVEEINAAKPDIVWVGLGAPKQERWMSAHIEQLDVPVLIGVGAAFDFHAGAKRQAPYWMQRSGLEWLFRLLTEPRRLWKRYLVDNTLFVALIVMQFLGLRRYSLDAENNT